MGYSAILLVGGFGTRLHPLTKHTPKPMLLVAGVPFIEHQILRAREAGASEIVLATSFMPEVFEPYFGAGEAFGISIKYAVEESALGTGGAIRNAANLLTGSGPVIIFNGDVLSGHDLVQQIALHESQNADVTLYLTTVADPRAYGAVEVDSKAQVLAFNEKMENPPTNTINAGCYIFSREIIYEIPENMVVSIERESFPSWLTGETKVVGYIDNSYWLDIGTPEALLKASRDLILGKVFSTATPPNNGSAVILDHTQIDPDSIISGGSVIAANVVVEKDCFIDGSIVEAGAIIRAGSQLHNCFVAENFEVPSGTLADFSYFGY